MKRIIKVDILLPCYNEEKTIEEQIKRIKKVINNKKYEYNIVICDNNSNDNSRKIAKEQNVKVLIEKEKGYGATLLNGINKSKADYIVMLDSDLSYNEKHIPKLLKELDNGYDFVIGNRFKGNIEKNAMPISHRYGSSFLTKYANLLFRTVSHDYHCGLRAFKRKEILKCNLETPGFEFASEMIIKAKLNNLKIKEIPTDLFVDGRDRPPHLKTIRDGLRHFKLITKLKFRNSFLFRYSSIFILLIFIYLTSLFLTALIPQKAIYNNTKKSFAFFEKHITTINKKTYPFTHIEGCGDVRNISMAYNMDSEKPIDSMIRMSYQEKVDKLKDLEKTFTKKEGKVVNYSRYWQGQAMYSKIMMVFTPLSYYVYGIQFIILFVLFLLITKKLWLKNKLLAISFVIMNIAINSFFTAFSVQYFFAILLTFVFTLKTIDLYNKNSNYISLLFAINGSVTCFFDFLTCETLVLTIPLFIYIVLSITDNKKIEIKNIIKYIFIWVLFYSLTFLTKWLIDLLYFGFSYINEIIAKMLPRVDNNKVEIYLRIPRAILLSCKDLIPFYFTKYGIAIFIILLLFSIYFVIFNNKKYRYLLLLLLIPIARYFVLSTHSHIFHYFTYRSYGIFIIFITYIFLLQLKKHKK